MTVVKTDDGRTVTFEHRQSTAPALQVHGNGRWRYGLDGVGRNFLTGPEADFANPKAHSIFAL